jgi:hypothetical protein
MKNSISLRNIAPIPKQGLYTADHVVYGIPIPKTKRIELFSPDEWEEFTEEWASSLKPNYYKVMRFAGSGDKGLDVVGFISDDTFEGGWDNYQCKHYNKALTPSVIWVEIGKIIYYTFKGYFPPPQKYYFIGSKGIGTKLGKLLASPDNLKIECKDNWQKYCENEISKNFTATLKGDLLGYFENFDFSVFSSKSLVDLITGHFNTPFHAVRFGGGFPARPKPEEPPSEITITESRYIEQIYEAYSDYAGELIYDIKSIEKRPELKADFLRQRERFYHAESLRNFARDTVPSGTHEDLQDDVYQGVVDTCESKHDDGFKRMRATITLAGQISISSSPLATVTKVKDKQGICHQLANDNRLIWVQDKNNEEKN